jgi:hypothetical protein
VANSLIDWGGSVGGRRCDVLRESPSALLVGAVADFLVDAGSHSSVNAAVREEDTSVLSGGSNLTNILSWPSPVTPAD